MTDELPDMTLKPIGTVRNEIGQPGRRQWPEIVSEIVVDGRLTEALDGIEDFSHIIVLYWVHHITEDEMPLKVHPMRQPELPLTGLLATRTPNRPNQLGKATVRLLQRQGNILRVQGLDAINGTPVIDIKPYFPGYDSITDARAPSWTTNR